VQLKIIVPSGVFASIANVERIVVMTQTGSFGLLPHRMDCVAVLPPGLFAYSTATADESVHLAVDAGMLIKTGANVVLCVRRAIAGADLGQLREAVERELKQLGEKESSDLKTLARLEAGLVRELVRLQRA
jgi:F-type H+-transporting ATPase subunit epsilon